MGFDHYYPVFLNLEEKKCIVIGGGKVAERKVRGLAEAKAEITVISPEITSGLKRFVLARKIKHRKRRYRKGDVKNAFLVIAATSDEAVNRKVFEDTDRLINTVDMPRYCNFIVPSVLKKGALKIAISSSGLSPAISRTLRKELEDYIPEEFAQYLIGLKDIRKRVKDLLPGSSKKAVAKRSRLLKKLGGKEILSILRSKGLREADRYIGELLEKELK